LGASYWSYLRLDRLLQLQVRASDPPAHDELLFITVHQVHELWFKLLLHELDKIKEDFSQNRPWEAIETFKRCNEILRALQKPIEVLETMTPVGYTAFRDSLGTASGFQSDQFRTLEFCLGYKRPQILEQMDPNSPHREMVLRALSGRSVMDHFHDLLEQRRVTLPAELRGREPTAPTLPSRALQDQLLQLYWSDADLRVLFEQMIDFDQILQHWRFRHVRLVERIIGNTPGTGGSTGVEFLKKTLFMPVFPDLWAIRHRF
jgi:tryptophan 2,3-dioxygenase